MRPLRKTVAVLVSFALFPCLYALPAMAQITLDFEGLPAMTYLSRNPIPDTAKLSDAFLTTDGVRFRSGNSYVAVVDLGFGHATSGVNGIGGSTPQGLLTYDRAFPIDAYFFDPSNPLLPAVTDFVSVRGDLGGSWLDVTLNAYDLYGNLLGSFTTVDVGGEILSISVSGIHSVKFLGTHDDGGVALDDFTFNPVQAVPESSSLCMFIGLGFAGLTVVLWRRVHG